MKRQNTIGKFFRSLRVRLSGSEKPLNLVAPEVKLGLGLQFGRYQMSLEDFKEKPHGVDLGALESCLPERLFTENKRINLAPELLVNDLKRLKKESDLNAEFPFALIGRRHLRDNNSWLHNSEILTKGKNRCTILMNEADAQNLNFTNEQKIKVSSRVGAIEIPLETTDKIMRGVVSIPHGYGHDRDGVHLIRQEITPEFRLTI